MKNKNSKKRKGRIGLVVFWIICIVLIVWMINISKNKKTGTEESQTANGNSNSVTELEKIKINEYVKSLDFAEIVVIKDSTSYTSDSLSKKIIFAQMEYLKYNPEAENDEQQIQSFYNKYFEVLSDGAFSNAYSSVVELAAKNRIENPLEITNLEGNEVLGGLSVYVYVSKVKKEQDGTYLVTIENVDTLNLSKLKSDNVATGDIEELKTTYVNFVNDENISEYQYNAKTYQLKLAVDNGRLYIKDF